MKYKEENLATKSPEWSNNKIHNLLKGRNIQYFITYEMESWMELIKFPRVIITCMWFLALAVVGFSSKKIYRNI